MCLFSGMNDLSTKRGHKKVLMLDEWIEQIVYNRSAYGQSITGNVAPSRPDPCVFDS